MKLVYAIVQNDDSKRLLRELTNHRISVTRISSTGGFLHNGNSTLMIGVEADRLQETLDIIGRKASVEQVLTAYRLAREVGFDNINMDIIAGLPGEDISDMEDTLAQIAQMKPDSLTVHSLAIKRAARMEMRDLHRDVKETHDILSGMIEKAAKTAEEMELFPYYLYRQKNIAGNFENVGYAKVDKAGIYNILIMEEKQPIIALGAGGSSKLVFDHGQRIERVENVKDVSNIFPALMR